MNGSIFQKISQIWINLIWENFEKKIELFCSKFGPIGVWIGHFFFKKMVFVWVYLSNFTAARPYQNQNRVGLPPPPHPDVDMVSEQEQLLVRLCLLLYLYGKMLKYNSIQKHLND